MVNTVSTQVSPLINNSNPLPDGSVANTSNETLAAAGTTQATATAITKQITQISNNTAANGVILPIPLAVGQTFKIFPQLATNAPKVYPPLGGSINAGTANASVAITAQKEADFAALDLLGNYMLMQSA